MRLKNIWLTSDPHYGHVRALEIMPNRPWKTVDEMNVGLAENHNSVVEKNDVVIFLGDVVMGKKYENVPKLIPGLNGTKFLVRGNHDAGFQESDPAKAKKAYDLYLNNGFTAVLDGLVSLNTLLKNIEVTEKLPFLINMCHFPYEGTPDHDDQADYEARYLHLMPPKSETLLFHGHTHKPFKVTNEFMIHVGVDAWDWKPVNLIDLLSVAELYCKVK
jgi:calcineurin-like phosphoesterase family protein